MKLLKIIISLIIITNLNISFSSGEDSTYQLETGYELYKSRVKNECIDYKKSNPLYQTEDYKEIKDSNNINSNIDEARENYLNNMDNIYYCALAGVKLNSFSIINTITSSNGELNANIGVKVNQEKNAINAEIKKRNCKNLNNIESKNLKKNVLDQTTYELCRYNYYLEYIKETYNNDLGTYTSQLIPESEYGNGIGMNKLTQKQNEIVLKINNEIENAYDVFPVVYSTYREYENSISTHFLLQVLEYDYYLLREKLHKALNPINQVVYKISNAMSK